MSARIEDHALLSDCRTAALVTGDGDVDWFCPGRFDAPSAFGALLGTEEQGHWSLRPEDPRARMTREYEPDTFVLVTRWTADSGVAEVREFLDVDGDHTRLIRSVTAVRGRVSFTSAVRFRFAYGAVRPWMRQHRGAEPVLEAVAGPDAMLLRGVRFRDEGFVHRATFTVDADAPADASNTTATRRRDLDLVHYASYRSAPTVVDAERALDRTRAWWGRWAQHFAPTGAYATEVTRSLLVLRALSHRDTGGIVAAPTTSLPELLGGARNWDYRYVWLRDAALTLDVLIRHHHLAIAKHWRDWLLRAVAGDPVNVQVLYGIAGEREIFERAITTLPGYEGAAPVRIGNGAVGQFQADVLGEVIVALDDARRAGLDESRSSWALQSALIQHVAETADRPDNGMWEIRGEPRAFTHSRVMVWAALDRGVRAVQEEGMSGDASGWAVVRDRVRQSVEQHGVDPADGAFVQSFGSTEVDASLLVLPQVGFCAPDDPHMLATVARIERDLLRDGLVLRYRPTSGVDGIGTEENPFLACSFWLVEQYARTGRRSEAESLMTRLTGLANDLGLLSEEFDVEAGPQVGNMPQAFSHLALVRAADALNALR